MTAILPAGWPRPKGYANGVATSMNFPSYPQFCGQYFARAEDKALALAVLRAYNDWVLEEWCGPAPDRYIPCQLTWLSDPEIAATEGHFKPGLDARADRVRGAAIQLSGRRQESGDIRQRNR